MTDQHMSYRPAAPSHAPFVWSGLGIASFPMSSIEHVCFFVRCNSGRHFPFVPFVNVRQQRSARPKMEQQHRQNRQSIQLTAVYLCGSRFICVCVVVDYSFILIELYSVVPFEIEHNAKRCCLTAVAAGFPVIFAIHRAHAIAS